MKKWIMLTALSGVFFLMFPIRTVFAESRAETLNEFSTGIVDIEIREYQKENGKESIWKDDPLLMPGKMISKIPRIKNHGNDCYVRVRIKTDPESTHLESCIYGIGQDWIKCEDGYYYYRNILAEGNEAELFQGLKIPEDFSQEYEGMQMKLVIDVDAVQSRNFSPDFSSKSPWGTVEIVKCDQDGQYNLTTYRRIETQSLQVVFQGKSKNLITNADNFFVNFPVLFPGDEYSDEAKLKNDSDSDIRLYFQTDAPSESVLLDEIKLKITRELEGETETVYEGDLKAEELEKGCLLAVVPKHSEGKMHFTIQAPESMDNAYAVLRSYVKWIFSTEPVKKDTPYIVQTGDSFHEMRLLLSAGAAALVLLFVGKKKYKKGSVDKVGLRKEKTR